MNFGLILHIHTESPISSKVPDFFVVAHIVNDIVGRIMCPAD